MFCSNCGYCIADHVETTEDQSVSDTKTQFEAFREFVDSQVEDHSRIHELEAENEKLRKQVAAAGRFSTSMIEHTALKLTERNAAMAERDELKKKHEKAVNVIQWTETDRESKRKEVVRLEAELAELRKDYATACELIGKTQDERDAATRERDADRATYQKKIGELDAECDDLKSRCDTENLDMSRMQSQLNTLKSNLQIVTDERDNALAAHREDREKWHSEMRVITRHSREQLDQFLAGLPEVLRASHVMYVAEMNEFRDHTEPEKKDMCGVDPSTGKSHRAKEEFLQACQRMFGNAN